MPKPSVVTVRTHVAFLLSEIHALAKQQMTFLKGRIGSLKQFILDNLEDYESAYTPEERKWIEDRIALIESLIKAFEDGLPKYPIRRVIG